MDIMRFDRCTGNCYGIERNDDEGELMYFDDHLEALAAQHKEDLEFAEWYGDHRADLMDELKAMEVIEGFYSLEEAYQHWLDNVKNKV